jgi:hypothetical protein
MNKQLVIAWTIVLSLVTWGCEAPMTSEEIADRYGEDGAKAEPSDDVDAIQSAVLGTFVALPALPVVTTAYGFALAASADDGSARLGFMFTDATYRASLLAAGKIQNMGGSYDGPNAYATYKVQSSAWSPYEGRTTPQTYSFSELVHASGASYYSTDYASFGGLISAIRNGGKGVYAQTPAFTTRKAHSISIPVGSADMYSLIAQAGTAGLTFSRIAISQFGVVFPSAWVDMAQVSTAASTVSEPQLLPAGGTRLAASYILGANAVIRATTNPATITSATNIPAIGSCTGAVHVDIAWDGTNLYAACATSAGVLTVQKTSLASLPSTLWSAVPTSIIGAVTALDLEGSSTGVSIAVRIGTSVKVYKNVTDPSANFDEVRPGQFDLARTTNGIVIAICDLTGDRTLRTWVSP